MPHVTRPHYHLPFWRSVVHSMVWAILVGGLAGGLGGCYKRTIRETGPIPDSRTIYEPNVSEDDPFNPLFGESK